MGCASCLTVEDYRVTTPLGVEARNKVRSSCGSKYGSLSNANYVTFKGDYITIVHFTLRRGVDYLQFDSG